MWFSRGQIWMWVRTFPSRPGDVSPKLSHRFFLFKTPPGFISCKKKQWAVRRCCHTGATCADWFPEHEEKLGCGCMKEQRTMTCWLGKKNWERIKRQENKDWPGGEVFCASCRTCSSKSTHLQQSEYSSTVRVFHGSTYCRFGGRAAPAPIFTSSHPLVDEISHAHF